jgi:hypothetical protein
VERKQGQRKGKSGKGKRKMARAETTTKGAEDRHDGGKKRRQRKEGQGRLNER